MKNIRFGTDGWRGVIGEAFTVKNLREVVQAILSYIKEGERRPKVLVGYDTRFMSEYYAKVAAEVAYGNGAKVLFSPRPVTTPILSYAVKAESASGGIMVTASHNPYQYNGIKFKAPYGGSAIPEITSDIEARIGEKPLDSVPFEKAVESGGVIEADFFGPYMECVTGLLRADRMKTRSPRIALDCMRGSAGYYAKELFDGLGLELKMLHAWRDPYFGGINPEPLEENLSELAFEVRESGFDMGFATDGDADRLGVVDGSGRYVTPHQVFALLLLHLYKNRGLKGTVVKTVSTSSLIDRIAASLGLPVRETPVGFKHICGLMLAGDVLIGGEENGGIGIKGHMPERDGMLAALLLAEMMSLEQKGLGELISGMDRKYGRLYYKRHDMKVGPARQAAFLSGMSEEKAKSVFGEFGIKEVRRLDGVKTLLKDGSWVLLRASGTEPLLRIYAEADDQQKVERLISRGREAFVG